MREYGQLFPIYVKKQTLHRVQIAVHYSRRKVKSHDIVFFPFFFFLLDLTFCYCWKTAIRKRHSSIGLLLSICLFRIYCAIGKKFSVYRSNNIWPCGLTDKASDFGSEDCRFESCHGQLAFFFFYFDFFIRRLLVNTQNPTFGVI